MNSYEWNVDNNNIINYLASCKEFVTDESKFKNFKQDSRYKIILEHVNKHESDLFISEMKNYDILNEKHLEEFRENDLIGNSEIYEYKFFGKMSPSTIRYIKNTLDIFDFIGSKKIKNIVEIGGGYGGLCKTINVLLNYDSYTIIDLPEVNALSKKYTDQFFNLKGKVSQLSMDELNKIKDVDLVISNYAFSECSQVAQMTYYNNIIANSKYFYMVYNNITTNNMNSTAFFDFASNKFDINTEKDSNNNYIYYGSKK